MTDLEQQLTEILNRYRYAVSYAAADAWDGGLDIRQRFAWARANDPGGNLSDNEIALIGRDFHERTTDPDEWRRDMEGIS